MDKNMDKQLDELVKSLEKLKKASDKKLMKELEKSFDEPCEISVKKGTDGNAECKVEGNRLAILCTLAGLEQAILDKTFTSQMEFERIKDVVGYKEGKK